MATGTVPAIPKFQFSDANGRPLVGGRLYTYLSNTSTPAPTYQDEELTIANENPIILDSRGEALIWLEESTAYRFVLKNFADALQWTVDDIEGSGGSGKVYIQASDFGKTGGNTIANLVGITPPIDGVLYQALSYYNGWGISTLGPQGGGLFVWDAILAKTNHNGGTIISPTVPWDGTQTTLALFLAGIGETQPLGLGCWRRVGNNRKGSIEDFGAKIDGTSDDAAPIRKAFTVFSNVTIPEGSGKTICNSQVVIPANRNITCSALISVSVNAASAGTPLFKTESSNVCWNFDNEGGYDFISAAFSNWIGFSARGENVLRNVQFIGGNFTNVGVNNVSGQVVDFSAVQAGGKIKNGTYKNCGVIGNVFGGGFAIYSDYCTGLEISGNTIDRCGSTGINSSTGLNNRVFNNTISNTTLFSFKAGYGTGIAVSGNIAPTLTQFSVVKNALTVKAMRPGVDFCIPRTVSFPPPQGKIKSIIDNGTYLIINLAQPSPALMTVGEAVQPLDTGTHVFANSFSFSTDNMIDANGMADFHVYNNHFYFGGHFTDAGVFPGLNDAVWVGYDPQGSLQSMNNRGVFVYENWIYNTKGCAVEVFSSNNVKLKRNECYSYNEGIDPTSLTPAAGGISFGRLGFNRNTDVDICDNTCISDFGFGILHGNFSDGKCTGNKVNSRVGIRMDSPQDCTLAENNVKSKVAGGYCYLIQDPSGANPGSSLRVRKNDGFAIGAGGHVFRNTDVSFVDMNIHDDNKWSAANPSTELFLDLSTSATFDVPVSGLFGSVTSQPIRYQAISPGVTVELGIYSADGGRRNAGCVFEGFARKSTGATEYLEGGAFGSVSDLEGYFLSKATSGTGSFVSLGDFTAVANAPLANAVTVRYTNNTLEPVSLVGISHVYSGM